MSKEILKEFRETIIDKLDVLEENFDRKATENLAQTVTNVSEGMKEIHKKQRLMEEMTADGRGLLFINFSMNLIN